MARFYITHTCRHEETHQIYGPEKDRDRKAEWLAGFSCSECQKKEREEQRHKENERNQELAAKQDLIALAGSVKQVAWATTIRQKMIDKYLEIIDNFEKIKTTSPEIYAESPEFLAKITSKIDGETQAKWFIENQDFVNDCLSQFRTEIRERKAKNAVQTAKPTLSSTEIEQLQKELKELKEQYRLLQQQQQEQERVYKIWLDSMEAQYGDIEAIPSEEWRKCPPSEPSARITELNQEIIERERILTSSAK